MDRDQLWALHRHWMWCNVIKKNFEIEVKKMMDGKLSKDSAKLIPDRYGAYMSIWYGMLFGVLEALKEEGITIPSIENDINSIYDSLRLYRNAVFHPQKQYWSNKLIKIMEDKDSVNKIWKIHDELGGYFLREIGKISKSA